MECTEVLITEFDEEDEDNQLLTDFCNKQTRSDNTFTTIKNSNATRWNSVLTMFNSFIKNFGTSLLLIFNLSLPYLKRCYNLAHINKKFNIFLDTINNCLASMKQYDLILSDTEETLAKDFVKILETFEKATDVMQGDTYPTLNLAVFCYMDIKEK